MDENKMVEVRNRNAGTTGYTFEDGFRRKFEFNEKKKIPLSELKRLSYTPGGDYILKNCLVIEDKDILEELDLDVELEYFYSENDIKKVLLEGNLDQLEDTLNFAPDGVIEIIKKMAVDLEIPDVRKRDMISKKTGFNINNAINVNHILAEGKEDNKTVEGKPKRKSTPINSEPEKPQRKYKVVSSN